MRPLPSLKGWMAFNSAMKCAALCANVRLFIPRKCPSSRRFLNSFAISARMFCIVISHRELPRCDLLAANRYDGRTVCRSLRDCTVIIGLLVLVGDRRTSSPTCIVRRSPPTVQVCKVCHPPARRPTPALRRRHVSFVGRIRRTTRPPITDFTDQTDQASCSTAKWFKPTSVFIILLFQRIVVE